MGNLRTFSRFRCRVLRGDICDYLHASVGLFSDIRRLLLHNESGLFISTLNNRTAFSNFDIVTHFSAGFISAWFAYDFACTVQGPKRRLSPALAALFAIGFACFISVGWETYEFTMDRIYGLTLQRTAPMTDSGLTDTMIDEIIQASGGLIGMFSVAFVKNGKIGRNRRMYAKKAKAAEERELLKEQLLKDYLNEQKNNPRS